MRTLLIIVIIFAGIFILQVRQSSLDQATTYQQRISVLVDFQSIWSQAVVETNKMRDSITFVESESQIISLIKEKQLILANYKKTDFGYQKELEILDSYLIKLENELAIPQKASLDVGLIYTTISEGQNALSSLLNIEKDKLNNTLLTNKEWLENVIYIILAASIWLFLLNIFVYITTMRKLKEHENRVIDIVDSHQIAQLNEDAKSEYMAMISHEIRTPMNGVLGMSNLLLQSSLTDEQKEYTNTIHHSTEKLLRVVNDVLDYSKLEAGNIVLENTACEIRELIAEVVLIYSKDKQNIKLAYEVATNVPKFIFSDTLRLRQILMVFLSNGIKFTDQGSVTLKCDIIQTNEVGNIQLGFSIEDTGIGIAKDKLPNLFKPFVQVGNTSARKYSGNGLGLNIAKNLISMMNGKVKVESEVGKGSIFSFYIVTKEWIEKVEPTTKKSKKVEQQVAETIALPKEEHKVEQEVLPKQNSPIVPILTEQKDDSKELRILAVDDNEINLMLITKTLSKLGYTAKTAQNGQQAVEMAQSEIFDLIFMDMQMPIMDGTTATTEIRKHFKIYEYPVVIALTANALGEGREKCLEAGMQDFIVKPFKPAQIEEMINNWGERIADYKLKYKDLSPANV